MIEFLGKHAWDWEVEEHFSFEGTSLEFILPFVFSMIIFSFLFSLLIAFIVYKDAMKKENDNAVLWFIIVLFSTVLGVILYVIVTHSQNKSTKKYYVPKSHYQGQNLQEQSQVKLTNFCRKCGSKLDNDGTFCQECGFEVRKKPK